MPYYFTLGVRLANKPASALTPVTLHGAFGGIGSRVWDLHGWNPWYLNTHPITGSTMNIDP